MRARIVAILRICLTLLWMGIFCADAFAQQRPLDRLPAGVLDVAPPSVRVRGEPGRMSVHSQPCRTLATSETRRRIVDIAVQEWGFFGFRIAAPADDGDNDAQDRGARRRPRLSAEEAARVASSIGGYWAVTPEGSWIVARQNDRWTGPDGMASRWNAPWSAAFISWVMCEAGLGASSQFQRAVAHHAYVDQALRARDGSAPQAAFVAYDIGEAAVVPGDLLCSSRRPLYRTIAERRRHMGVGARSHCDIVVKVDEAGGRVMAIGGNVRGVVSLKTFPVVREGVRLRVHNGSTERPLFVHMKLRAAAIEADALEGSPTMEARAGRSPRTRPAGDNRLSDARRGAGRDQGVLD